MTDLSRITVDPDICHGKPCVRHMRWPVEVRLVNRLREIGVDAAHLNRIMKGSETRDSTISAYVDVNGMLLIVMTNQEGFYRHLRPTR